MARSRSPTSAPPPPAAGFDSDVQKLTGEVATLNERVDQLNQLVATLTSAIDDIREEFAWAVRNDRMRCEQRPPPMHITSMPKDPLAKDFGERVNRYSARDVPPESVPDAVSNNSTGDASNPEQRELW